MKLEGGLRKKGISKTGDLGKPLLSVVTVVYNGATHLEQAVQSVMSQPYDPIEYLIVDGGSTDGTLDIIRKYEDRIDFLVSEPDRGISDAMNKGIRLANGDLIAHLHADDYYSDPSVLSSVCSEYLNHPDALWLIGGIEIVDGNGKILQEIPSRKHSLFDTERWVRDRLPYVDIVLSRLSSRNHRWWTFVMRILRGQIMVVPSRQPSRR